MAVIRNLPESPLASVPVRRTVDHGVVSEIRERPGVHPRPLGDSLSKSVPLQRMPHHEMLLSDPPENIRAAREAETSGRPFAPGVDRPNFFAGMPDARGKLEAALASVLKRQVGAALERTGSEYKFLFEPTRMYEHVETHLNRFLHEELGAPPHEEVRVLTGGVRNALGYLYEQMYDAASKQPHASPEATLRRIANERGDLSGLLDRGASSDWDMYLVAHPRYGTRLQKEARRIINEVGDAYQWSKCQEQDRAQYFTVADVNLYDRAHRVSMERGGVSLDWLAFDLRTGKLVEPPAEYRPEPLHIVDDLLAGYLEYYAPSKPDKLTMPGKQALRGLRPLLEIPYLRYRDETVLKQDLDGLVRALEEDEIGSDELKALFTQMGKTVANQRAGSAAQRAFRGAPGSPESYLPVLDKELTDLYRFVHVGSAANLLARSLPVTPLQAGHRAHLQGLLRTAEVRKLADAHGRVYVVAPYEHALQLLRNGLLHGPERDNLHPTGALVYASRKEALRCLSGESSAVVEQTLRQNPPLRVLDWEKAQADPRVKALWEEAQRAAPGHERSYCFERLARQYGVDGILENGELRLQRAESTLRDGTLLDLVRIYGSVLENHARLTDAELPVVYGPEVDAISSAHEVFAQREAVFQAYSRFLNYLSVQETGAYTDAFSPDYFRLQIEANNLRLYARAFNSSREDVRARATLPREAVARFIRDRSRTWSQLLEQRAGADRETVRDPRLSELTASLNVDWEGGEHWYDYFARRASALNDIYGRGEDLSGIQLKELTRTAGMSATDLIDLLLRLDSEDVADLMLWPVMVQRMMEEPAWKTELEQLQCDTAAPREIARVLLGLLREDQPAQTAIRDSLTPAMNARVTFRREVDLQMQERRAASGEWVDPVTFLQRRGTGLPSVFGRETPEAGEET